MCSQSFLITSFDNLHVTGNNIASQHWPKRSCITESESLGIRTSDMT